ncbi:Tetratricopeptide repeat protein [Candidatus Sulfopaludibacter sp. SbA3]|nr:Tetratricopeptide repeat protein [Candidatus Sulfopaludibacter sp. SbA3]
MTLRLLLLLAAMPHPVFAQTPAETLIAAGHWKRARVLVDAAIRERPNDALANFLLSQVSHAFGDSTSPLPLAEKAVALNGGVAKFHRQVAEAVGVAAQRANPIQQLFLARRFRKEIDRALELDPQDAQAWRDLMEYYRLAPGIAGGDRAKAIATAKRLGAVDPAEGFMAQAQLSAGGAESLYRQAVECRPGSYRARIALASFYLEPEHRNFAAAEAQAREAMRIEAGRVDAYVVLARAYAEAARWSDLDALLETSAKEVPDDLAPYYRAAEVLQARRREPDRARRYLEHYLTLPPEGNQPTLADARRALDAARRAAP